MSKIGGQELFYVEGDALVAGKVDTRSDFKIPGKPDTLFSGKDVGADLVSGFWNMYDVAPDGRGFVVVPPLEEPEFNIVVVQNWFTEFK